MNWRTVVRPEFDICMHRGQKEETRQTSATAVVKKQCKKIETGSNAEREEIGLQALQDAS